MQWHYLGKPPLDQAQWFGVFCPDMVCALGIARPSSGYGLARKLGLERWEGNWEVVRVIARPEAPRNTASRSVALLMTACRGLGIDWLFSYADTGQNHHGGIYQAVNAVYVGLSERTRGYILDGRPVHRRTLSDTFGTKAWPAVRELAAARGQVLETFDEIPRKHTYVLPCGPPAIRRAVRLALVDKARPYPKRATAGEVAA